jgi:hypothetical protein
MNEILITKEVDLTQEACDRLEAIKSWNGIEPNYLLDQAVRVLAGLPSDYTLEEVCRFFAMDDRFQDL